MSTQPGRSERQCISSRFTCTPTTGIDTVIPTAFPVAYDSFQRIISLPLNPRLGDKDVGDVIEAVLDVVRAYRR
jgi:dTDP-4-amino-4,6-dideoxygalactose transaminase